MTTLAKRLDTHFAACAAAAAGAAMLGGEKAEAGIVYSGIVNIAIGGNFAGVYLNMVTGVTGTSAAAVPGHDINPYYGGNRIFVATVSPLSGVQATGPAPAGQVLNLAPLAPINGGGSYFAGFPLQTSANFIAGSPGLIGIRLVRESDSATLFGWVRMIRSAGLASPGTIVDYAYEDSGQQILAGFVPAPGSLALLALGALGVRGRRRS